MPGLAHLYIGEEAVAVGVCEVLRRDDYITSTHRGHGHCLAKGASIELMFCELLGKEAGYCRGKGGSMHIADHVNGNLGANAIVAGSAGIATGAAFSARRRGTDQVAVCFFGEGALGQGVLYEVMNMSSLWKLPVVYVCENNLYNEYTHYLEVTAGDILARPRAFGFETREVDGQDVRAVYAITAELVARARAGGDRRVKVTWDWVEERLVSARNFWLATSTERGPYVRPVWCLWRDGALLFTSSPTSRKVRAIKADPRVSVHLELVREVVVLDGTVEETEPAPEAADAYA
jgi:transketolase N-terminal domain/subunit